MRSKLPIAHFDSGNNPASRSLVLDSTLEWFIAVHDFTLMWPFVKSLPQP